MSQKEKKKGHKTYLNKQWWKLPLPREENKYPDPGSPGNQKKKKRIQRDPHRPAPRHRKWKWHNEQGGLKAAREAAWDTRGPPSPPARSTSRHFSTNSTGQRETEHSKCWREKLPNHNTLPRKLPFRIEAEIHSFPEKQNLKKLIITRMVLQETLEGLNLKCKSADD